MSKLKTPDRLFTTRLTEALRWLEANHYRLDRDYTYEVKGPYVMFTLLTPLCERGFTRKFTPLYR